MRKAILPVFLLCCLCSYGQQIKVRLSGDSPQQTVQSGFCSYFFSLGETDAGGNTSVSISVENTEDTQVLLLFGQAWPEKQLKQFKNPTIKFDKVFNDGTKGKREIEPYKGVNGVVSVKPALKYALPAVAVSADEPLTVRLPFYISRWGNKKQSKLLMCEKNPVELIIEVESQADEDYRKLYAEYEKLKKDSGQAVICTNSRHRRHGSVSRQEDNYTEKKRHLKKEIDNIVVRRNLSATSHGYRKYSFLKNLIDGISLDDRKGDCGIPDASRPAVKPKHTCKYDGLSLQQIYDKLDDHYKRIRNSSNRQEAKANAMSDVNLLYRCCTDKNCKSHEAEWNAGGLLKNKIAQRYSDINNL